MTCKQQRIDEIDRKLEENNRLMVEILKNNQEGNLSYFLQQNAKMALAKYSIQEEIIV
jgi:hypothetical protein